MSVPSNWYAKSPAGSPDNYVTTRKVVYSWANPPQWIYDIIAKKDFSDIYGQIYADPFAAVPTLVCSIEPKFFFDISVIGGNERTLPGALPHDRMYSAAKHIAWFYGIPRRTVLHIADHWFLATLRMAGWIFPRTYFIAVRTLGYAFHSLFAKGASKTLAL